MNIDFKNTFVPFQMRGFTFEDCKELVAYHAKRLHISLELVPATWRMENIPNAQFVCFQNDFRYAFNTLKEVQQFVATLEEM